MQKNVASQKLIVFAFDSTTNLPKTGDAANLTAYVSKDYGAITVLGDTTATEMDATNAKGYYLFDLTQAETNADTLLFSAKSSTANIVVIGVPATVFTTPANFSAYTAPLSAAGVRSAVGLASANLDTQFTGLVTTLGGPAGASVSADIDNVLNQIQGNNSAIQNVITTLGASGGGLTSLGDPRLINLDAAVSTRLATAGYTTPPTAVANADALLGRNVAGGSSAGRLVKEALYMLRNKVSISGTTLTVFQVDDVTPAFTAALTTDAAALPITAADPA